MAPCAFCELAAGRAGSELVVYRTDRVVAFVPHRPDAPGHVILTPTVHCASLFDAPAAVVADLAEAARQLAVSYRDALGPEGVNVLHASGRAAQQSVPHLHLHLIPRQEGDGLEAWPRLGGAPPSPEAIVARLRDALGRSDAPRSPSR